LIIIKKKKICLKNEIGQVEIKSVRLSCCSSYQLRRKLVYQADEGKRLTPYAFSFLNCCFFSFT